MDSLASFNKDGEPGTAPVPTECLLAAEALLTEVEGQSGSDGSPSSLQALVYGFFPPVNCICVLHVSRDCLMSVFMYILKTICPVNISPKGSLISYT